jgi:hypothetical protein
MLTPLILALAAVVVMDLAARIIPDIITLPMLVYACLLCCTRPPHLFNLSSASSSAAGVPL